MRFNLNQYFDTISFTYVNEIFRAVYRNIIIASEKNNLESFNELMDFLIYELKNKAFNKSINGFSKSVTTFIYIFPNISSDYKRIFVERVFESLTTKIGLIKNYDGIDIQYIELSYLPLINIFKYLLQDDDYELFNISIDICKRNIIKIDNSEDRGGLFFYFVTTLLAWIYYLKKSNAISYEMYNLEFLENSLENMSYDFDFIFINSFFELFDKIENENLWAVSDWEIKEPPINEAYFALMPRNWLPYGLIIILMKFDHFIRLNDDLNKIKLNERIKYIFDDIKKVLSNITVDNEEYRFIIYNEISSQDLNTKLNYKKDKILNVFSFLDKQVEINYYNKIKGIPLSEKKIEEFRNNVGKLWEENLIVLNILKNLGNLYLVPNDEKVKGYGFFQRLLKMKFAFIDGEYYQNIIGLNDFGSQLARSIDNDFFNNLNTERIITTENVEKSVLSFIIKTKNKNNLIIFANWRNADRLGNLTYEPSSHNSNYSKQFMGVPVLNQFSKFKNSIVVIDFSLIKVKVFTSNNPNWYKKQLLVEITESQKNDITEDIIKKWNEKDDYNYNQDEVDILESNNVNLKVLFKYEFIIPDEARYIIIN